MHELHQLGCTKYWKKYSHDNNSLTSATCTEARKLYLFDAHDIQNSTCLCLVKHLPPDCRVFLWHGVGPSPVMMQARLCMLRFCSELVSPEGMAGRAAGTCQQLGVGDGHLCAECAAGAQHLRGAADVGHARRILPVRLEGLPVSAAITPRHACMHTCVPNYTSAFLILFL